MESTILPIESIHERDIDLLLLEELNTEISFCKALVKNLGLEEILTINGAWRSMSNEEGETDILFSYNSSIGKIFLLLENKLNAVFQPNQFERYNNRAKRYINRGHCDFAYPVLIAPEKFCKAQSKFKYITYEDIQLILERQNTVRSKFKKELLEIAIFKHRRGRTLSEFCNDYWDYFTKSNKMIDYSIPRNSNANRQAQFYPIKLPKFTVYHLFEKGEFVISAMIKELSELELKKYLESENLIKKTTKNKIGLRFPVSPINTSENIDPNKLDEIFDLINEKIDLIKEISISILKDQKYDTC